MSDEVEGGWSPGRVLEWLVVGAVSVPVVAGFVVLGAAVVAGRSARDLVRVAWGWLPGRGSREPGQVLRPDAA